MQIVYKHMGLDQTPWRWRSHSSFHPSIPIALPLVSSGVDNAEASIPILLSGALGGLQVVDAVSAKVLSSVRLFTFHHLSCRISFVTRSTSLMSRNRGKRRGFKLV